MYQEQEQEDEELTKIQKKILRTLEEHGPLRRGKENYEPNTISGITDMPRTTVIDNLQKLEKKDIVECFEKHNGKRGRPPVYWKINGDDK
jgi:predicted ArsR family transcriptional regulator